MSGCHSTIDRPDSLRRVIAPITIIAKTMKALTNSQIAMGFV